MPLWEVPVMQYDSLTDLLVFGIASNRQKLVKVTVELLRTAIPQVFRKQNIKRMRIK